MLGSADTFHERERQTPSWGCQKVEVVKWLWQLYASISKCTTPLHLEGPSGSKFEITANGAAESDVVAKPARRVRAVFSCPSLSPAEDWLGHARPQVTPATAVRAAEATILARLVLAQVEH